MTDPSKLTFKEIYEQRLTEVVARDRARAAQKKADRVGLPKKSFGVAILLWLFLGLFGAHRFYLGFWKSGLVRLFTLNFLGIGWLIDSILVVHLYNERDGWLDA